MRTSLLAAAGVASAALLAATALPVAAHGTSTSGPTFAQLSAAPAGTVAVAVFDRAADTTPQVNGPETSPRGVFVFRQVEDAADTNDLTVSGSVRGLAPRTQYVTVAYRQTCAPLPGVNAFPSAIFTTDRKGRATLRNLPLNPQAINPAATLDTEGVGAVSIRSVLVTAPGVTVPDLSETETCDVTPFRN